MTRIPAILKRNRRRICRPEKNVEPARIFCEHGGMNSVAISLIAFVVIFSGAILGLLLQKRLPSHHLSEASRDTIKLGAGLIATLSALVLGLLVSSATGSFHKVSDGLTVGAARAILLDKLLEAYGPGTAEIRRELRTSIENALHMIEPESGRGAISAIEKGRGIIGIADSVRLLQPATELQKSLYPRGIELSQDLLESHWVLLEQDSDSLPVPFLAVLLLWLSILNVTYGLFAPRNGTVIAILLVCALSVAGAIFLIEEMDRPLDGFVKVSGAPLRDALQQMESLPQKPQ